MAKATLQNKPRIFISHAWEDKPLARRLEAELKAAGAEVWVDHEGIRGGDNLPERISNALGWCNTLLLVWSDAASASRWVKLEWTNAVSLEKAIIPCKLTPASLPAILAHKAYLDFRNIEQGLKELLRALDLAQRPTAPIPTEPEQEVAKVIHSRLMDTTVPAKPKPPQNDSSRNKSTTRKQARSAFVSDDGVTKMIIKRDYYDKHINPEGKGIAHQYKKQVIADQSVVIDQATKLMWQQAGSEERLTYAQAKKYIRDLNRKRFASYSNWRLPTLEEAMSLMEREKHGDLYIDTKYFDSKQKWIWTADKSAAGVAWVARFAYGACSHDTLGNYCVRGVR